MASIYPIRFASQMREHLRALRKKQGLTQAQLGTQLGVSQARIAEIEANPGLVSFEQLLKLLSQLESGFLLQAGEHASQSPLELGSHVVRAAAEEVNAHVDDDEHEELLYPAVVERGYKPLQVREDEGKFKLEDANANIADAEREAYSFHKKKGSW